MSAVEQLDFEHALRARDAGITQVLENSDADYRSKLYAAILSLAETGQTFCADQLRDAIGEPPAGTHFNVIGAVFQQAASCGLIRTVGFTRSARVVGHSNVVRRWVGVGRS